MCRSRNHTWKKFLGKDFGRTDLTKTLELPTVPPYIKARVVQLLYCLYID